MTMREILFRGKRTDNGEWVTGKPFWTPGGRKMIWAIALHPDFEDDKRSCYYSEGTEVVSDTIGQYIGLTDKNGKKIFEGDILSAHFDFNNPDVESRTVVEWGNYRWVTHQPGYEPDDITDFDKGLWTVIGNIHDNPELMEDK